MRTIVSIRKLHTPDNLVRGSRLKKTKKQAANFYFNFTKRRAARYSCSDFFVKKKQNKTKQKNPKNMHTKKQIGYSNRFPK